MESEYGSETKKDIEVIVDRGFRILAYATAVDGIKWEELHSPVQDDLDSIMNYYPNKRESINYFFSQFSETDEEDTVSAFKPDLIGEYIFLEIWKNLFNSSRHKWFATMQEQDYFLVFLAHCLNDWPSEFKKYKLYELISNQSANQIERFNYARIFNYAVKESNSENEQIILAEEIRMLNHDQSVSILSQYTDAIKFIFDNSKKALEINV